MKDQYGRTIDYLRISITDACNLRCRYCMPESAAGCALEQAEQNPPLTVEEMLKIVHAAAGLGITQRALHAMADKLKHRSSCYCGEQFVNLRIV